MYERKRTEISIKRDGNTIVSVPITKDCKRVFRLMEEDYIKLVFVLTDAVELCVNDYIEDEVFGRFYLAKKQAGVWETKDGVYKYDIEFVAEYMMWANYEYMYTSHEILRIGTKTGDLQRKESEWYLTARLKDHLDMVIDNLRVLGFEYGYKIHHETSPDKDKVYCNNAEKSEEVKYQQNKSISIIDALNALAEDYECEWWVEGKTIHFGKCVHGEEIEIDPKLHLSSFAIKDNRNDFCNVVRAYGGNKNIPTSYRKELYLTIDRSFVKDGVTYWVDLSKKLSPSFFNVYAETNFDLYAYSSFKRSKLSDNVEQYACIGLWKSLAKSAEYTITLPSLTVGVGFVIRNFQTSNPREAKAVLQAFLEFDDNTSILLGKWENDEWVKQVQPVVDLPQITMPAVTKTVFLTRGKRCRISFYISCLTTLYLNKQEKLICSADDIPCGDGEYKANCLNDKDRKAILDVTYFDDGYVDAQIEIALVGYEDPDTGDFLSYGLRPLDGETIENLFVDGRIFLVHTDDNVDIPQAYYLDSFNDPSSLARLGSGRLRLPIRDDNQSLTYGTILDKETKEINNFATDSVCISQIVKTTNGRIHHKLFALNTSAIKWEEYYQPMLDINGNPMNTYYNGYIELTDLVVGDEVVFGNKLCVGIKNMVRWVALDADDYIIDYSRENNSKMEDSYLVGKGCVKIFCSHYYTEPPFINIVRLPPVRTLVEKTIVFDDIYPKMQLYVKDIKTTKRIDKETFEGDNELTKEWNWLEYTVTLQTYDGRKFKDFDFKNRYILQDEKLQIQFLYPDALEGLVDTGSPCKLAGMTFDAKHVREGGVSKFTIVRNDDFGAKLPSDLLCPSLKDPCTLIGWNIKAVQSSGIIDDAESRLYDRAMKYKKALEDNPYTFECTLFAHFVLDSTYEHYFADANGKVIVCSDGKYFVVNNNILLTPGQKIKITDPTLHNGYCKSRVIGFEYNLDIPWDNPKITVGETDAYSRLAKIEKQISNNK